MSIFRSENGYIYTNASYIEFYIPVYYFDPNTRFATRSSDKITTLGLFNVGIFENSKLKELRVLNLPATITIFANPHITETRMVKLINGDEEKCVVIKYVKNSKVMLSTFFKDDGNAKMFMKYILAGNLPKVIPYSKLPEVWQKNQAISGVGFGLPSLFLELLLAAVCRNPDKPEEKYSNYINEKFKSPSDKNKKEFQFSYSSATIREICRYNSTFTAITFQDMDSMITASLNRSRKNAPEKHSPLEQIIKF